MLSMQASLAHRIDKAIGATDARIIHEHSSRFDADVVARVRALAGVEAAGGRFYGSLTLVPHDQSIVDEDGRLRRITVDARGADLDESDVFQQIELSSGRPIAAPDELLIDPITAKQLRTDVGATLEVQRFGEPILLRVVGIIKRPLLGALQRPRVQMERHTLADAVGTDDEVNLLSIKLDDDIDVEAWVETHSPAFELPLVLETTERIRSGFERQIAGGRLAFLLGAVLGFLACSLIVATGMSTAAVQQQREMAVLRLIGAARGQLIRSQLIMGGVLCTIAGVLGVPFGNAIAWLLCNLFSEFLPAGFQFSILGAVLSISGATAAGLCGALLPAVIVARVTPMEALRVQAKPPEHRAVAWCFVVAVGLIAVQLALQLPADPQWRFWSYVLVGLPLLVTAWFLMAVPLCWVLRPILGPLIERLFGLPAGLLQGTIATAPWRIGLTAGALMIGIAILTSTWSNGAALLDSVLERVRFADAFVFRTNGLTADEQQRISTLAGVAASSPVGYLPLRMTDESQLGIRGFGPQNVVCVGFEVESFLKLNRIEWVRGTPEEAVPMLLEGDAVLVAEQFLLARGLDIGGEITLGPPGREQTFKIAGVVTAAGLDVATQFFGIRSMYMDHAASCVFMDIDAVARHFNSHEAYIMQLVLEPGIDLVQERSLANEVARVVPGARFSSGRGIKEIIGEAGMTILSISSAVAFVALFLSSIAVGNLVAAGITARRFEFGVLRAVGSPNSLLARIVYAEVLVIVILAGMVGIGMGFHLAWMGTTMYQGLAGLELEVIVPYRPLVVGLLIMATLTAIAASWPIFTLLRKPTRDLLALGG